ncbi:MAG: DUF3048 domain-containing protein [Acidimicrobiales bacterium]
MRDPHRPVGLPGTGGRVVVLLLAAALVGAGCSGSKKHAARPAATRTTTTVPPTFPLTGLAAADPSRAARPALEVKIDNVREAMPQVGIDAADVIYEEVVEGGLTRLMAVFQSNDAAQLGPVRSVRPTDPNIASAFGGVFAYSGGSARFDQLIRSTAGIVAVSPNDDGAAFPRRSLHAAPHNQYTSTPALYKHAPAGAKPPPAFSPFLTAGQPFAPPGGGPATHLAVTVGSVSVAFDWDPAGHDWKRSMNGTADTLEGGKPVTATTVIVQFVPYTPVAGATDPTGAQVDEAQVIGSGDAWVLANGTLLKGRWSKPTQSSMTSYTDAGGAPIALPAGQTWVELPRAGATATTS